jgi:regulator of sirC expression with transglutaminase-like and TPR domain
MDLDAALDRLAHDPAARIDPVVVALHLARDEYPQLDVDAYLSEIDGLAHEARPFLGSALEGQVTGLCRFLFHEVGFRGNDQNYYDPRNSYLNEVIDRQTGIPLTLSLVTMAVGRRAGLRIDGVGLPGHFIVMARAGASRVLFDPYHGGRLLDPFDCEKLVRQSAGVDLDVTPDILQPATPGQMVTRVLSNLKGCYLRAGAFANAARVIGRLIQVAPGDATQRRDLGTCLFQAGQHGRAIDHLAAYLAATPNALDTAAVTKLLRQARSEVAKWN